MNNKYGRIIAIHGPMFSGKTEELLRRIRRAKIAKKKCQLFKPTTDNRYADDRVLPHFLVKEDSKSSQKQDLGEKAIAVKNALEIKEKLEYGVNLVGIEEAQFFDYSLFYLIKMLSKEGIDVVFSLLDQDFRRMPFVIPKSDRTVGDYLAISHVSIKLSAICVKCGDEAQYSQKLVHVQDYPNGEPVYVPASFYGEIVTVGTNLENSELKNKEHFDKLSNQANNDSNKLKHSQVIYEARCLNCHDIPDEPDFKSNKFDTTLPLFQE